MRSLMISFTIIMFVFTITVVNIVDAKYYETESRSLFGFNATAPLDPASQEFFGLTNQGLNQTFSDFTKPRQDPVSRTLDFAFTTVVWVVNGVKILINIFINTTLKFHDFIQHLGRGDQFTLMPEYLAVILSIGVNANHLIGVIQFIRNISFKNLT